MILIVDFGSQFNQLIARRVREHNVYCQVDPPNVVDVDYVKTLNPEGIILSGGPSSIYDENSPKIDKAILDLGIPVLGICYGMQFMLDALGATVERAEKREYGFAELMVKDASGTFTGVSPKTQCWMSHGDSTKSLPEGFEVTASTANTEIAAVVNKAKRFYGLQFHPEVEHTTEGSSMLANFIFDICGCKKEWTMKSFAERSVEEIRNVVGDKKVILGLSGGVDSSGGGPSDPQGHRPEPHLHLCGQRSAQKG